MSDYIKITSETNQTYWISLELIRDSVLLNFYSEKYEWVIRKDKFKRILSEVSGTRDKELVAAAGRKAANDFEREEQKANSKKIRGPIKMDHIKSCSITAGLYPYPPELRSVLHLGEMFWYQKQSDKFRNVVAYTKGFGEYKTSYRLERGYYNNTHSIVYRICRKGDGYIVGKDVKTEPVSYSVEQAQQQVVAYMKSIGLEMLSEDKRSQWDGDYPYYDGINDLKRNEEAERAEWQAQVRAANQREHLRQRIMDLEYAVSTCEWGAGFELRMLKESTWYY